MTTINDILEKERHNKSIIYLYACGDQWCAYEHSAYHFVTIFQMGDIENKEGSIRIRINNEFEFLNSQAMSVVEITSVGNDELKIDCGTAFAGFEQWKQERFNQERFN